METSDLPGTPVGPGQCALAVGIPTTLNELERQWEDPRFEFLRREVMRSPDATAQTAWNDGYEAFAQRVRCVVSGIGRGLESYAACAPITVVWDADLGVVRELIGRFHVVTVLGHSPFRLLALADILHPDRVLAALTGGGTSSCPEHRVAEVLRRLPPVRSARDELELLRALNPLIQQSKDQYRYKPGRKEKLADMTSRSVGGFTGLSLYEAFPLNVKPPLVLELADGMHDFEELVQAVPEDHRGVLELLTCSGMWFAAALRRRRPASEAYLGGHQRARFLERITLYKSVIELLAERPMPYRDAVRQVHSAAVQWARERQKARASEWESKESGRCKSN
jgi:hypothetical protein